MLVSLRCGKGQAPRAAWGAYAAAGAVALHRHGAAVAPFTTRTAPYRVCGTVPLAGHGEITPASGLNSHMLTHNGKKPHSCKQCNFSTTQSGTLQRHIINIHSKEKPFSCKQCSFSFSQAGNLKSHSLSRHSSEKPFSCKLCTYSTADYRFLKKHTLKHTSEKANKCE